MSFPRRPRAWWRRTVTEFAASGLDRQAFAERVGVHPETLRYWLRELRAPRAVGPCAPTGVPGLVRVELSETTLWPPSEGARTVAALVGPAELRFDVGTEPGYVGALVAAITKAVGRC